MNEKDKGIFYFLFYDYCALSEKNICIVFHGQSDHWIAVISVLFLHAAFPFSIGLSAISCSIFLKPRALAARPCILLVSRPVVRAKSGKKRAKDLGAEARRVSVGDVTACGRVQD